MWGRGIPHWDGLVGDGWSSFSGEHWSPKQPPKSFGCPLVRAMTWGGPVRVSLLPFSLLPAWVEVVLWQTGPSLLQDRDLSLHP